MDDFLEPTLKKARLPGGTQLVPFACMTTLSERVCVALVLLGTMLILLLFGHTWLPLSASNAPYRMPQPDLPGWHGQPSIEYRG